MRLVKGNHDNLKRLIKNIFIILAQGEKKKLLRLALSDILINMLDLAFLVGLLYVINFYTQPFHAATLNIPSLAIFNQYPLLLITVFFLLFSIKNLFGFLLCKMEYNFVYEVASRISRDNLLRYFGGTYQDYVSVDSSVFNRKISQQPIEFCHYVLNGMQQAFSQSVIIVFTIITIIIFNPLLFPLLVVILAPPVFLIAFLMKRRLDAARLHGKKTSEKTMQHLQEALSAFVESNTYEKKDFFTSRYHRFQLQLNHYLSERLVIQSLPPRLIEVFAIFGLLILVLVNYFAAHDHFLGVGTIGTFMVAAYKVIPGIVKITNITGQVKTYAYATDGLAEFACEPLKNNYPPDPVCSIVFEKVSFSYPGKNIINAFSLNVRKGDMVAITGISGRGKTTFVNLLLGFLTPTSGSIYINGSLADTNSRQGYWSRIGYIKQQPFFLHASIMENITLHDCHYDEVKIRKIMTLTGIDKWIDSFPNGLKTVITENGKNFSGGQRQRIIFARALYKDFDLLILDEPFHELDESSEMDMLGQLQKMSAEGKIILLITHNKAALRFCNKKILMDASG